MVNRRGGAQYVSLRLGPRLSHKGVQERECDEAIPFRIRLNTIFSGVCKLRLADLCTKARMCHWGTDRRMRKHALRLTKSELHQASRSEDPRYLARPSWNSRHPPTCPDHIKTCSAYPQGIQHDTHGEHLDAPSPLSSSERSVLQRRVRDLRPLLRPSHVSDSDSMRARGRVS